jgi:hypothetical protein
MTIDETRNVRKAVSGCGVVVCYVGHADLKRRGLI